MDEKEPKPEQPEGGEDTPAQESNVMNQNQPNQMTSATHQITAGGSSSSSYPRGQLYSHHYIQQFQHQQLQEKLDKFWEERLKEIENTNEINHALPLARIKKIMKADDDVKMIAAEAPVLFSKACEIFIMELTTRAWANAEENKRKTLQKSDIASAIARTDTFDFLVDTVPRDETIMEREVYVGMPPRRGNADGIAPNVTPTPLGNPHPYYYLPSPAQHFGDGMPPRMVMTRPPFDHAIYMQRPPYPYGQVLQYPTPKHLMIKTSPDSDDQTTK